VAVSRDNADVPLRQSLDVPVVSNVPQETLRREIPPLGLVEPQLRQVNEVICRSLTPPSAEQEVMPLLGHLRGGSGKMLRAATVLLAGRCFGPLTEPHIRAAALMEMIHQATLLHDDVIDDGHKRRGKPTANRLWGNESAVLLGDFVLSQVFRMTADFEPSTIGVIAQTAVRVCQGELRQALQRGNWRLSEAQYLEIITEKSAAFFSGCSRLGGLLAHASPEAVEALAAFGLHAGIAFQITDDLLDITGAEDKTGKTGQRDLGRDKLTLAVIHLLRTIEVSARAPVHALLEAGASASGALTDLLVQHGSLHYARAQAERYVAKATDALAELPPSPAKDALLETARFMADRAV
jgi:octaprenyl-diphosphate synthase